VKRTEEKSLVGAATSVTAATLISRILGLIREQVVAHLFGARWQTDAFNVAFRIPNLLRDLFAEGALSAAFVPTFTQARIQRGESDAWLLASRVMTLLVVVLSLLTLGIFLLAEPIVLLLAPGFAATPGKVELAAQMARVMSPFLLFIAIASVMMGVLNAHGRFFVPALAPAAFNVASILCALWLSPLMPAIGCEPIVALAAGALVGGIGQFAVQVPAARGRGFRYTPSLSISDPGVRRMLALMLPATIGLSATQVSILVDTQFASRYGEGAVSYLSFAFRLIQLPIGLFGVAIATANLAAVSRHAAAGDMESLRSNLARAIRLAAFLTLPATAGLAVLREPIIRLLYEHGRFTSEATLGTARVLLMYVFGLFAYSLVKIFVPTFYALGETRAPVRASVTAVVVKIALNFPLTWAFGYAGLALSTSVAAGLNFAQLALHLRRRLGALEGRGVGRTLAKIAAASALVGLAAYLVHTAITAVLGTSRSADAAALLVAVGAGGLTMLAASRLLGIEELDELMRRVLRRRGRPSEPEGRA